MIPSLFSPLCSDVLFEKSPGVAVAALIIGASLIAAIAASLIAAEAASLIVSAAGSLVAAVLLSAVEAASLTAVGSWAAVVDSWESVARLGRNGVDEAVSSS